MVVKYRRGIGDRTPSCGSGPEMYVRLARHLAQRQCCRLPALAAARSTARWMSSVWNQEHWSLTRLVHWHISVTHLHKQTNTSSSSFIAIHSIIQRFHTSCRFHSYLFVQCNLTWKGVLSPLRAPWRCCIGWRSTCRVGDSVWSRYGRERIHTEHWRSRRTSEQSPTLAQCCQTVIWDINLWMAVSL